MAARDGDVALWLHNKLGSTDDLWSGSLICSQLTREKLLQIQDCFHGLQPHVKVKLMLSFLHLHKRNVEEWKTELDEVLQLAQDDTDQWVVMVSDIMKTFPSNGSLNTDLDQHQHYFHEVQNDLKKLVRKSHDIAMTPLECCYLSRSAQVSVAGPPAPPLKHFALKRKPKSAALRADLLHKSSEAAINLKKGVTSSVPVKFRTFAKKMEETQPGSKSNSGFLKPNSFGGRFTSSAPVGNRPPINRREGGIKMLEASELPVGPKEAKRRKKVAEQEALEKDKKDKEAQAATPDYAAGLIAPTINITNAEGPSYVPSAAPGTATRLTTTITLPGGVLSSTAAARENLQQQLQQQLTQQRTAAAGTVTLPTAAPPEAAPPTTPAPTPPQADPQMLAAPGAALVAKKGLSLTKEQMLEAQEMFRTSNKVTRPEKALILGFMAGSRDNPCPKQGDIVNIRLSEHLDSIQQPDGLFRPMMVDTYIQMNYSSGDWKRVKKYRECEEEES